MQVQRWLAAGLVAGSIVGCAEPATAPLVAGEAESRAAASQRPASSPTIVDVALAVNAESGEFSTLIAAVVSADLVAALSAVGQRTVFAPTDAAFAELGLDADNIGDLPAAALKDILLYHVAAGRRYAADVVSSDRIRMANGGFTRIKLMDGAAYINDSQIVVTDVEASNGVIHIIDAVLLP
jgi:transforming growth factor-beta-induced protein